jgi:hypothetical protein
MSRLSASPSHSAPSAAQLLFCSWALLLTGSEVLAENLEDTMPSVAVSTTGTVATIGEDGPDSGQFNFDIELAAPAWAGHLFLMLEAGAGPPDPISCGALSAENTHAFAASSGDVRLVEFSYQVRHSTGDWAIGFQEARGTIDTSLVANDDKLQFLAPAFVNNPTISLPDSSLGLSWQRASETGRRGIGATATRYEHSGAFLAAESWWHFDGAIARIGAWRGRSGIACDEHAHKSSHGQGLYAGIDGQTTNLQWNLRVGWGRHGEVPVSFVGLAVEMPLSSGTIGLALGQGRILAHEEAASERHAEIYYRYSLPGGLTILPGLQLSDRRRDGSGLDLAVGFRFGIGI